MEGVTVLVMKNVTLLLLITCLLASCAFKNLDSVDSKKALSYQLNRERYETADSGTTKIKISLWDQKVWLLNDKEEVLLVSDVSTGIDGRETPARHFEVLEKSEEKRSNRYGRYVNRETREVIVEKAWEHEGAIPTGCEYEGIMMPYWIRLTWYGIGMHVGEFERRMRSSFGCIRVYEKAQPYIFQKVELGTPVEIVSESLVAQMHEH